MIRKGQRHGPLVLCSNHHPPLTGPSTCPQLTFILTSTHFMLVADQMMMS